MPRVLLDCSRQVEHNPPTVPELFTFPKHAVPREIAAQIRSYMRVQWPHLDGRGGRLWDVPPSDGAVTFVLMHDQLLVSHASVKRWDFAFEGGRQKILGLSAVFTYPAWRGSGFGRQIVHAATAHLLRAPDADAAILFCSEKRIPLYESTGWQDMATTT